MADRRDLTVGIDGDPKGFDTACKSAEQSARVFERELDKVDATMLAVERTTARTAQLVESYAKSNDKAAISAARLGVAAKEAADKAASASVKAAEAAKKLERGELDAAAAAQVEARAQREVEKAAIAAASAQLAEAKAAQKLADEQRQAAAESEGMRGGLASLITAGVALAPPIVAAGAALVAFAAVGAPSIMKVVTAQQDLAKNWSSLDRNQKVAAANLAGLIDQYKALAKSYSPDALRVFNGLVSTARGLLPQLGTTVDATKQGVADFATTVENSAGQQLTRLFGLVRSQGTPALHELGTTFDETASLAVNLVQGLAPMGMTLLHSTNGVLGLLNAVTSIDPRLTEFAAVSLALRAPTTALGDLWTKNASKLSGLAKEGSRAESFLSKLGKTVGASPNLYIGAALAVGYLATRLATAKDSTDNLVAAVRTENSAFGNNIKGHQDAARSFANLAQQTRAAQKAALEGQAVYEGSSAIDGYDAKIRKLTQAQHEEEAAAREAGKGEQYLSSLYGISADQAGQLATAAGVDLSKGITGSSDAAVAARAKIAQYNSQVEAASDPTKRIADDMSHAANTGLLMKDRLTALTDALSAYYGPASAAWNATTQLKQGMADLAKAMAKAHGDFSGNTAASRALRTALDQQLTTIANLHQANLQTKGYSAAQAAAEQQVQVMYALAGRSKDARAQVDALAKSLQLTAGKSNLSHDAFIRAAEAMVISRARAEALWQAYQKLPAAKQITISDNANAAASRVNAVRSALNALHDRQINITTYYRQVDIGNRTNQANRGDARGNAHGGLIKRFAVGGPSGFVSGPGTATSDSIPALLSNGEFVINAAATARFLPLLNAINSGWMPGIGLTAWKSAVVAQPPTPPTMPPTTPLVTSAPVSSTSLDLGSIMQQWQDTVKPASKSDVDNAAKDRLRVLDQLRNAQAALRRAEHMSTRTHAERVRRAEAIAAAERRIAKERRDLTDATRKLHDVERRYQYSRQTPAQQLGNALAFSIRNNAAFIHNLEVLTDRGFGVLAQQLLAMGGPEAEKIAASAVKMTSKQLSGLQGQILQERQQQDTLAHLPQILSLKTALKGGASSWDALLQATGMSPNDLAATLKLMSADLQKTATGRALLEQLKLRGYATGGLVVGPAGVDRVPIMATAGEYVVKAGPAAANRQYLDALNAGATVRAPVTVARGGDGASLPPITITVYARDGQSALAVAKETSHELGWALKSGSRR